MVDGRARKFAEAGVAHEDNASLTCFTASCGDISGITNSAFPVCTSSLSAALAVKDRVSAANTTEIPGRMSKAFMVLWVLRLKLLT